MCKKNCECVNGICSKMQKESIRTAVDELEKNTNAKIARNILETIKNAMEIYDCFPKDCLCKRIEYVMLQIDARGNLNINEKSIINILISEIEVFLSEKEENSEEGINGVYRG